MTPWRFCADAAESVFFFCAAFWKQDKGTTRVTLLLPFAWTDKGTSSVVVHLEKSHLHFNPNPFFVTPHRWRKVQRILEMPRLMSVLFQVRRMMSGILAVGSKQINITDLGQALNEEKPLNTKQQIAPAAGLYLKQVHYNAEGTRGWTLVCPQQLDV